MNTPLPIALPLLALLILAARSDALTRRIPNRLVVLGLCLAIFVRVFLDGVSALPSAVAGTLVAGGLLLPGWLLGWTGAGDVKLMSVVGAWLGATLGGMAVLLSLIAGGVLALVVAVRHGMLRRSLTGAAALGAWLLQPHAGPAPPVTSGLRFPFAFAILAGSFTALWVRV